MVSETSVQYNVEFSAAFQIVEFHKRVVVSPCFPQQPQIQALENAPGDDRISQPNISIRSISMRITERVRSVWKNR